ncbi:50S ribosomal protein L15e [Candidatus Woesearchaeota archaeon]|nr:50S ribosomal protein L15e [Candidatus Woesearchaeota archaeon]
MGMYKYLREAWKKPTDSIKAAQRERMIYWRKQDATVRVEHPTRIDRARSLGYKAKQGFLVVRQRVKRGGKMRPDVSGGRRPKASRMWLTLKKNYQWIAEEKAVKKFTNCEVLNSYWAGQDGKHYWYEVILIDRSHPNIQKDPILRNIASQRGRAARGLTSAGKKTRSLRGKGKGYEKAR